MARAATPCHRRIVLEDLEILVQIGIYAAERQAPQRVLIDATLEIAEDNPDWGSDHIGNILDYDFLYRGILDLVSGRRFNLQETLCAEIMAMCLARSEVAGARIRTRKPDIYPNCTGIGVEMEYSKQDK